MFNIGIRMKVKNLIQLLLVYAKKHPFILLGYFSVFILGVVLRIFVEREFGTLQWDEGAHSIGGVFLSRLLLNILQGRFDLAGFSWRYLADYQATIGGLWFYPFGYSFLTTIAYLLFGYNEFAAHLPSLVLSILLVHATICLAKEIDQREKVALVSAFLVATSSAIIIVGSAAMVDIPLTTLTMYSILYWIRGMKNQGGNAFLKAGLLGGVAGLMKPSGVLILLFMIIFQVLTFLVSRDNIIFSKKFWKAIFYGFLVFSTWWGSALILKVAVGGWLGEGAYRSVLHWVNIFGGYTPPLYTPSWYTYEGWTYYANFLIILMGVLPFIFFFIGVGSKLKDMKRNDTLLILFSLSLYTLQSFVPDKNPRYMIVYLPILYIYSSIGLTVACSTILKRLFPQTKSLITGIVRISMSILIMLVLLLGCMRPTFIAIETRYIPGMGFGPCPPIREALDIIVNDMDEGIIILDSDDNFINVHTLTFYIASIDYDRKYGCYGSPLDPADIPSFSIEGRQAKYVLVHNLDSAISKYIWSNPEYFVLLGTVENSYGVISVYKVC